LASLNMIDSSPAFARGFFRFIFNLPQKVARAVLPRALAPIGAAFLEIQLGHIPSFRIASRVNDAVTMQNNLKRVRDVYRQQADKVDTQLNNMKAERDRLYQTGPTTLGISVFELEDRKKALDQIIPAMENASTKLNRAANNLNLDGLVKLALQDLLKRSLGNVKNIITGEVGNELRTLTNANAIYTFLSSGGGKDPGALIDSFISGDISRILGDKGSDKDLVARIKQRIQEQLKNNAEYVQHNWRDVLEATVAEVRAQGDQAIKNLPTGNKPAPPPPVALAGNWEMKRQFYKLPFNFSNDILRRAAEIIADQVIPIHNTWELLRTGNQLEIRFHNDGLDNILYIGDKEVTWYRNLIGDWGQDTPAFRAGDDGKSYVFETHNTFSAGSIPGMDISDIQASFTSKVTITISGNTMTGVISVENIKGTYYGKGEDGKMKTKPINVSNFVIPYQGTRKDTE